MGTQNTVFPSSVIQALFATGPKFDIPGRSFNGARNPCLNRPSERSNGRQVIRSPAAAPLNFAFSPALYSLGAVGPKDALLFWQCFVKGGTILSCPRRR